MYQIRTTRQPNVGNSSIYVPEVDQIYFGTGGVLNMLATFGSKSIPSDVEGEPEVSSLPDVAHIRMLSEYCANVTNINNFGGVKKYPRIFLKNS